MKITILQLLNAAPALQSLSTAKLPAKSAFHVSRLIATLQPDLTRAGESRNKLFETYGNEVRQCSFPSCGHLFPKNLARCPQCHLAAPANGDGLVRTIPPERIGEFRAEIEPLLDSSLDIACEPLPIELIESLELTPIEMGGLLPFLAG